jgi:hypothetical protein
MRPAYSTGSHWPTCQTHDLDCCPVDGLRAVGDVLAIFLRPVVAAGHVARVVAVAIGVIIERLVGRGGQQHLVVIDRLELAPLVIAIFRAAVGRSGDCRNAAQGVLLVGVAGQRGHAAGMGEALKLVAVRVLVAAGGDELI